jgi:Aromatic acid exporter family member 1
MGSTLTTDMRDLLFLAGKAFLACLVTLLLDGLVGNPDHVSSTFVAVLSVSAVALMGLRSGVQQLVGSALGGIWGTLATAVGLHPLAAVPLAVGLAVVTAFAAGASAAYPIAAFTALYLVLVPQGTPLQTLGIRLLAVTSGAVGGLVVNLVVSALFYRQIYTRRLRDAEARVRAQLPAAAGRGPDAAEEGFALLAALQGDLDHALTELRWRRARATHAAVRRMWWRVEHLRSLLHLASNVGEIVRRERIEPPAIAPLLDWLRAPSGPAPAVPEALAEPVRRAESALRALDAVAAGNTPSDV